MASEQQPKLTEQDGRILIDGRPLSVGEVVTAFAELAALKAPHTCVSCHKPMSSTCADCQREWES